MQYRRNCRGLLYSSYDSVYYLNIADFVRRPICMRPVTDTTITCEQRLTDTVSHWFTLNAL